METFLRSKHAFIKHALFGCGFALLAAGSLVSRADQALDNQLIRFVIKGDPSQVKNLLEQGANINARMGDNGTALMLAAENGNKEIVKLLLDKNADVNAKTYGGEYTALMFAAGNGEKEIVQLLLDKGANRKIKDKLGNTAANYAKNPVIAALLK